MKMLFKSSLLLAFAAIFVLASCKKEDVEPNTNPTDPGSTGSNPSIGVLYSGNTISTSIGGTVTDQSNMPVSNAVVSIGSQSQTTDQFGVFYFDQVSVDDARAYVKIEKAGYFLGSRAFKPNPSATNYVRVQLISKTVAGTIQNSSGGAVNVSGGATLTFEPGDVSLENGTAYSGNVNVYAAYLDAGSSEINRTMPGDLMAVNTNSEAVGLETFGMIAVELTGTGGEALNVTPGQTVEVNIPVSVNLLGSAPSSIPLWYFDEANGYWVEEGSATLQGNSYVGTVSHFSFWNCDAPFPTVDFECTINCYNTPMTNTLVVITLPSGSQRSGITDANGQVSGEIPQNVPLVLEVIDECGSVVYSQNIPATSSALNLGNIFACSSGNFATFVGTVTDCNNNPVTNGLVRVELSGNVFVNLFTNQSGQVNSVVNTCALTNVNVTAFDLNNSLQSATISVPTGPVINLGSITTCSQVDEFINYQIDGNQFNILDLGGNEVNASGVNVPDSMGVYGYNQPDFINFGGDNPVLGANPGTQLFGVSGYQIAWPSNGLTVTYTTLGTTIGSYVEGTISGSFQEVGGPTHTITGSFRARLDY